MARCPHPPTQVEAAGDHHPLGRQPATQQQRQRQRRTRASRRLSTYTAEGQRQAGWHEQAPGVHHDAAGGDFCRGGGRHGVGRRRAEGGPGHAGHAALCSRGAPSGSAQTFLNGGRHTSRTPPRPRSPADLPGTAPRSGPPGSAARSSCCHGRYRGRHAPWSGRSSSRGGHPGRAQSRQGERGRSQVLPLLCYCCC